MATEIALTDKEKKMEIVRAFSQSPIAYARNISRTIKSIKQILDMEHTVQVSELRRISPTQIGVVMIKFLEGTIEWFGYKKEDMSNSRIEMLVNSIMDKYFYFTLEDVCLCFKKGREDDNYEKFYGRLDCSVFLRWFAMYDKERENVVQSHPSNSTASVDLSNGVPFEKYEKEMLERIEEGDEEAKIQYEQMKSVKELFESNMGIYKNYQYNRKHRFDNRK